jgi:hypothetical protein
MNCEKLIEESNGLFILRFDENWQIIFQINLILIAIIVVAVLLLYLIKIKRIPFWGRYDFVEGDFSFIGLGKVKIKPNHETINIAYQARTELITRKVALPFEKENDVIVEVYNSWYSVFGILRELAKSIPAHKVRFDQDTKKLVDVMIAVLNQGLRPHLTKWQAKFRRWYQYEKEKKENLSLTPQKIQQKYPEYEKLIDDMQNVNNVMVKYADWLQRIVEKKNS